MKHLKWLLLAVFLQLATVCRFTYNELGERSYYYYYNGQPVYPVCTPDEYPHVVYEKSQLRVHLCNDDQHMHLDYIIHDFDGPGFYKYVEDDNSLEVYYTEGLHIFDRIWPGTYIQILEWDPATGFISALFEAHVSDSLNDERHITLGRLSLYSVVSTSEEM